MSIGNDDIIKSIKRDFRLGMNGVISTSMREKGINYKINFGLSLPQLRTIAEKYAPNREIATRLWQEDIRESKLLAAMLFPIGEIDEDFANNLAESITQYEVADIAAMFLFAKLPFANKLALDYAKSEDENKLYLGLRIFVRLLINRVELTPNMTDEFLSIAKWNTDNKNMAISSVANNIIERFDLID